MSRIAATIALCVALAMLNHACALKMVGGTASNPIVNTKGGKVQGAVVGSGTHSMQFLGIPFAAPPVADYRWRPPQPVQPWTGVRQATTFQPNCAQPNSTNYGVTSEDCLYLNVFVPAKPRTTGPLPVMLWFYGGSWVSGGAALPLYTGVPDTVIDGDVIIVTTNYRLGAFGFLGSDLLRNRSSSGTTGNYGLLDQRAAMVWVHDNIANFGGDASKVTIYGESAGAGSVSTHLVMEGSAGYFHQAIMESGPMAIWVGMNMTDAQDRFDQVLHSIGCADLDCLMKATTNQLEIASHVVAPPRVPGQHASAWSPVIDKVELMGKPSELAAAGRIASVVPTLLGTNHDEGSMFVPLPRTCSEDDVAFLINFVFGSADAERILAMYPLASFESPWFQFSRALGDYLMTCPARRTARWMLRAGATSSHVYFFTHRAAWIVNSRPWLGVAHTSELPFVFDFPFLLSGAAEKQLAKNVAAYWTNFAAYGDPNTSPPGSNNSMPLWQPYDPVEDNHYQNLNLTISSISQLKEAACDMWDDIAGFKF